MTLRENIIHEAQKLFSLNGFLNTGINEIIDVAGTSKGGFYNHFCSKEDLFLEVLVEAQKIWRKKVLTSIDEIDSPTDKIIQILLNYRDRYLKDADNFPGGCIFITFSVELDDTRPHLAKEVYKGFEGFKRMLKRLLDEAVQQGELPGDLNTTTVTEMLFTGMLGASVLYGVNKSTSTLDCSIDSLIEYLYLLGGKQVLNHVHAKNERAGIQKNCFGTSGE
ncbi:MAG: TetR/AcrR family transcriptional regulator [Anaerolineales bacterium]|jgi:TetR/AcrR family transcriptional repressor of nem operon